MIPEDYNEDYKNADGNYQHQSAQPVPLGKGQKIAVAVLAVFAILAIVMWSRQFKNSISGPFEYNNNSTQGQNFTATQENNDNDLRNKDTDLDGLSDWDELNLYLTSPFLEDSDSDGFSDKEEIDAGKDPNCPAGRDCYGIMEPLQNNTAENNLSATQSASSTQNSTVLNLNLSPAQNNGSVAGNISGAMPSDAASLRQMLLDAGMDANILSQFSDADLLAEWQKTFSGTAQ